jgi:hypothetical protein
MESIINFYNSLLLIQFTTFGLTTTIFLLYFQLIYNKFSLEHIKKIIFHWTFIFYTLLSVLNIFITFRAYYLLSFGDTIFNLKIFDLPPISFAYLPISLFVVCLMFFLLFLIYNFKFLHPKNSFANIIKSIKSDNITSFLLHHYDIQPPQKLKIKSYYNNSEQETKEIIVSDRKDVSKKIAKKLKRLKKRQTKDPFMLIRYNLCTSIINRDVYSIEYISEAIEELTKNYLDTSESKKYKFWHNDRILLQKFTEHLLDLFNDVFEDAFKKR